MNAAWPVDAADLETTQRLLAATLPPPDLYPADVRLIGGCFVCSAPAADGDALWAAAATVGGRRVLTLVTVRALTAAPYVAGLLALREGAVLADAVGRLAPRPDVLLVNATGLDHPRGAGLAVHLGAVLGVPTVGVTHRPLMADGEWPGEGKGARSPIMLDGRIVGCWVRTRPGRRPVVAHAAWRTSPDSAAVIVTASVRRARTPEPLRRARQAARTARAERVTRRA